MHRPVASLLLAGLATFTSLVGSDAPPAEACGAFFAKAAVPVERRPSLSVERVLILHDPEKQVEHFIREIVFRGDKETFGFVVPTPTRPDVFKVKEPMFNRLETSYPFQPPDQGGGSKGANRGAPGGAAGGGPPKVTILDIKKVGSFTAFVLAATDASALGKFLKDNGLSSTPENDAWLQSYVERKFFYVAFRYEPNAEKGGSGQPRSETVRISFKTPLAYYPYSEPKHPSSGGARDVGLWVVSPERVIPVSLAEENGKPVWVKPFVEGWTQENVAVDRFQKDLGPEEDKLMGAAPVVVQPFEDQKESRQGYGDVVFIPLKGVPEARRKDAAAMMELLRPSGAEVTK